MIDIRIESLTKRFGAVTALNGIDLTINGGELFFLLGPSGCGKTTLLRTLAGFYTPDSGQIRFGTKNVINLPPHKRQAGMVFQSYALWPHMTVAQNIAFGLEQKKLPKAKIRSTVADMLAKVRLEQYADRRPNELSGGQQQRVALARALIVKPRCLLLDEPLSNLDAQLRNEMRCEIRAICKEHKLTTIYVTHDQKEALSIADRIAVFSGGKIQQIGSATELYRRPQTKFVAKFIGDTNIIEGVIVQVGAGEAVVRTKIGNFRGVICPSKADARPGKKVYLSIRPECLVLSNVPTKENCASGHIGNAVYFGEVAHYDFEKNGVNIRISELNPANFERLRQANEVYAHVSSGDVVILSE
ncbi:MAG: ABC transporter ATP-binding protein [Puniceicoccales bacterium]|jgi:iron(III) transport system ATP-binding protein|nr:ABC transporter ATP-binding protein [Puniceicoccales bacterium]